MCAEPEVLGGEDIPKTGMQQIYIYLQRPNQVSRDQFYVVNLLNLETMF